MIKRLFTTSINKNTNKLKNIKKIKIKENKKNKIKKNIEIFQSQVEKQDHLSRIL